MNSIDLLIGGCSGIISRSFVAPIDLHVVQKQNNYMNRSIHQVIKNEGIRYLWKGNLANCFRVFPQYAINYTMFSFFDKKLFTNKLSVKNNHIKKFASGFLAGTVSAITIYPLETIRTRLMLQKKKSTYKSPLHALRTIPFNNLYKGLSTSILGTSIYSGCNFYFYNQYKSMFVNLLKKKDLNDDFNDGIKHILCGGFAGMTAITVTHPTDLIRRRLQMQGYSKKVPKYNNMIDAVKQIYASEGIKGFYRGLLFAQLRTFPCLAMHFYCIETGNKLLKS